MRMTNYIRALAIYALACIPAGSEAFAQATLRGDVQQAAPVGNSTREMRDAATKGIPFAQLTPAATAQIRSVVDNASYFRRMPTETVTCDPEMFTFLVRNPEVMVGIWDVMGITRVTLNRVGQYQLAGDDGSGTTCKMDLIFGDDKTHIYAVNGAYKGSLWPKELHGNSIILIHNSPAAPQGVTTGPTMQVTMDVFLKLENLGADLVVRTLGPLVNKSADNNFHECLAFVEQVSQVAANNPTGLQNLAGRIQGIDPTIREQFIQTTRTVASRSGVILAEPLASASPANAYSSDRQATLEYSSRESRPGSQEAILSSTGSTGGSTGIPSGRPISTRRTQSGRTTEEQITEPKGDSPTLYLLNQSSSP